MKYCKDTRPFSSVEEMNEYLVDDWNSKVKPGDTVYHLGDFSFGGISKTEKSIDQLQGNIHLIYGNHDKVISGSGLHKKFASTQYYLYKTIAGTKFALFHFPMVEWENMYYGSIHLFGHVHDAYKTVGGKSMNVGVDTRPDTSLYHIDEVLEFCKDKPINNHPKDL